MTRIRSAWITVDLAGRRISARPLAAMAIAFALAGAGALIGWSSLAAALSNEENVRVRLAEVPSDERSVQVVYHVIPGEIDPWSAEVSRFFAELADVTQSARRVRIWHSIGPNIRLVVPDELERDVMATVGRLPAGCKAGVCEALVLAGDFRMGQRVRLGEGAAALIVGRGLVRPEALPLASKALPRTPKLQSRTLLVEALGPQFRPLSRDTGTSVVSTAALDSESVRASDLRTLAERLREESVRVERSGLRIDLTAPFDLLDDIADRGDVARIRLLLVAGQAAALILAFAAYAAAARRRESALLDEQLDALGASPAQVRSARVIEAAIPSAAGALLALVGLYVGAHIIAAARGLPSSFVGAAVPLWTVVTIVATTGVAITLLVASLASLGRRRSVGPLELAAMTALGVVIWQTVTTGALDAETIEEGGGVGPVLVLMPALAFFAAGVLLLRAVPFVLRRAERMSRGASFAIRLGFLSAARRPAEAAAATTFLAVALGTALFGLNYRATLERQARDEARFTVGGSWRVSESAAPDRPSAPSVRPRVGTDVQPPTGADVKPVTGQADVTPLSRYASATSERPTPVLRLSAGVAEMQVMGEELPIEVLALPADRIPQIAGWREDFSGLTREEIARTLRPRRAGLGGLRLARDAVELRAWMRSDAHLTRFVVLHFFHPDGQRFMHLRGPIVSTNWRRLRIPLPATVRGGELVGVEFPILSVPFAAPPDHGALEVGGFEQRRAAGWSRLASIDGWTASSAGGKVELAEFGTGPVRRRLQFSLQGTALALLRPTIPDVLPALVSERVAASAVDGILTLQGVGKEVPVQVVATARLFPTVIEQPSAFVVIDYESLFASLNADQPGVALPTEAWFFGQQPPDFLEHLAQPPFRVESVVGVEPLTARLVNDPLGAGARDVLLVSSAVAAVLGLLGLALASRSALGAERLLLAEYEALGIPPSTITRSLQFRLLGLSSLGVVAGLVGALVAVRLVGAAVAVTGAAGAPLPPIEPVVAWGTGVLVVSVIGVAALVTAMLLAGRAMREPAATRLRA